METAGLRKTYPDHCPWLDARHVQGCAQLWEACWIPQNLQYRLDVSWEDISPLLENALKKEQTEEQQEMTVVAQGLAKAATLLADQYQWVITNVPYLARGKQNELLRKFWRKTLSGSQK